MGCRLESGLATETGEIYFPLKLKKKSMFINIRRKQSGMPILFTLPVIHIWNNTKQLLSISEVPEIHILKHRHKEQEQHLLSPLPAIHMYNQTIKLATIHVEHTNKNRAKAKRRENWQGNACHRLTCLVAWARVWIPW